jgi:hypothetical protein
VGDLPVSVAGKFTNPSRYLTELSNGLAAKEKRQSIPWATFNRWLDCIEAINIVGSMPSVWTATVSWRSLFRSSNEMKSFRSALHLPPLNTPNIVPRADCSMTALSIRDKRVRPSRWTYRRALSGRRSQAPITNSSPAIALSFGISTIRKQSRSATFYRNVPTTASMATSPCHRLYPERFAKHRQATRSLSRRQR